MALEIETRSEGRMGQRELLPSLPMALVLLSGMVALMAVTLVSLNSFINVHITTKQNPKSEAAGGNFVLNPVH